MKTLHLDLLHALRTLRRNPGYAAVAILLFALGIGANTAIFSVANSVLLRPLPYAEPERLVVALHNGVAPVSPADYLDYQRSVKAFEQIGAAQAWSGTIAIGDQREQISGLQVTPNLIGLLGVKPILGRGLIAGQPQQLLLSHGLWKERFGADETIVGRTVQVNKLMYVVAGVMPESFRFAPFWATRARMWVPLDLEHRLQDRDGRSLRVFGRLKHGVSVEQAQAEMDTVAAQLAAAYPATNAKLGISVVPLHEKVVNGVRPTLLALLGTVGFVLLIACATVGNLMLSRSVSRRKEMALRLALGADNGALMRIPMFEVLVLAAAGAGIGLLLGSWSLEVIATMLPAGSMPRQSELTFDSGAVLFGTAAALMSALLAGVLPSIQATRANVNEDLKDGGSRGSTSGRGRMRSQSALVSAEVALSLLLMGGAGLMIRTMMALSSVDGGFNPQHLLTMQISLTGTDNDQPGRRAQAFRDVRERLAASSGIESVSAINHLPIGGDIWGLSYTVEGRPAPLPGARQTAVYRVVMPGYMRTMQIGLVEGRDFTEQDSSGVIINEAMAKHQWPAGQSAIGQVIHYGLSAEELKVPRPVIGIVRNARQNDWTSPAEDEVYMPYFSRPDAMGLSYMTFVLRTSRPVDGIVRDLRTFNPSLAISEVVTMERVIADEIWRQRLAASLMGAFALVAVLLAAAGIYGVISHSMRQRAQEIGIRMALGAKSGDLIQMVLWDGMRPVWAGLVAGAAGVYLLSGFLTSLVYGVGVLDAGTFAVVALLLTGVSMVANLVPALRATRVDPVIALRHD